MLKWIREKGEALWQDFRHLFDLDEHYAVLRRDRENRSYLEDFLQKSLSTAVVSTTRFFNDDGIRAASALTYYTVLSLIPILVLLFSLARGLGAYEDLEGVIRTFFAENPSLVDQLVEYANQAVEKAQGGVITWVGIVVLLWSVLRVLSNAEATMNHVWRIRKGRNLKRMITDYFSFIIIAPILIILGSSMNVFITTNLETYFPFISRLVMQLFKVLPYLLTWTLFIFLYMFLPARRVRFKHALLAGLIAGTLFQVVQWLYLRFQVGVSSYSAIYGSLAALPLMLVWMQLSWCIVLWGTELCYIFRNRHFIYKNDLYGDDSWTAMIEAAIRVVRMVAFSCQQGKGGVEARAIAQALKLSASKTQLILDELTDRGIVKPVREEEELYMPTADFHDTSVADIVLRLSRVDESRDDDWKEHFKHAIEQEFAADKLMSDASMEKNDYFYTRKKESD